MERKPHFFISRTTGGLAALTERVAEVLRQRGIEPIIQTGFYPSTHDVKGMFAEGGDDALFLGSEAGEDVA